MISNIQSKNSRFMQATSIQILLYKQVLYFCIKEIFPKFIPEIKYILSLKAYFILIYVAAHIVRVRNNLIRQYSTPSILLLQLN